MKDLIAGYEADIYRGLWDRPKTFGALRAWAAGWLIMILYAALMTIMAGQSQLLMGVGLTWVAGQALLVLLTQWDQNWDRVLVRWAFRRGAHYYRAG